MTGGEDGNWVSLKDASARAGVSISWLRKQYRNNGLPTRDTVGPRGLQKAVPLDEVVARAAVFTSAASPDGDGAKEVVPPAPPAGQGDLSHDVASPDLMRELLDRLFEAQARAARAEAEAAYLLLRLDDAYAEIDQLRSTS